VAGELRGNMGEASATRLRVVALFLAWAAMFVASYAVPMTMEATGDGFTRGLNRLGYWFWPQAIGFVLAIVVWMVAGARRAHLSNRLVWLARLPLLAAAVQVLIFIVLVVYAMITIPS
jgi:hypothetical protein